MHNLAVYNPQTHKFDVPIKIFDPNYTFNNRCFIDQSNKLWAVTPLSLRRYNSSTLALEDSIPMQGIFPTHFFMHTNGILWLAGNRQITLFDTHTHKFKETPQALRSHPLLLHANVNYIHPYGSNSLLLNTDQQGMFLYNYVEGYVIHQSENGFPFEVPHFKISTMFTDSQKNLWIGSVDQGYVVRYNYKERFNTNNHLSSYLNRKSSRVHFFHFVAVHVVNVQPVYHGGHPEISLLVHCHEVKEVDSAGLPGKSATDKPDITRVFVDDEGYIWLAALYASKVKK